VVVRGLERFEPFKPISAALVTLAT
jgi:hypothetical protein